MPRPKDAPSTALTPPAVRRLPVVDPKSEYRLWVVSQAMVEHPGAKATTIQAALLTRTPAYPLDLPQVVSAMRQVWVWWRAKRKEALDDLLAAELAKLDRLEAELWPIILGTHVERALSATQRLLQVSERRARFLGLDAPSRETKQSVNVHIVRGPDVVAPGGLGDTGGSGVVEAVSVSVREEPG